MLADPILSQVTGGRTGLGSVWIITGSLWASKKLFDQPRPRFGLALGLFLLAALFTDFQILFFTTIWLLLYGFYRVYFERDSLTIRPLITALGLAGLIVGLPFAAVYLPVFLRAESTGYPSPGFAGMLVFSFQLKHLLWPAIWPLLAGGYEMVLALFAALIFFRWTGRYRFWLVSAFVFLILALGPYLQPTRIPMPFAAFSLLEPLQQFRTPARLTIAAVIGFSAVVAHLLAALLPRLRSSRLLYLAAAILIGIKLTFAVSRHPLLLQTYPNYPIYSELAEETADFTILEIPVGVRSGLEKMGSGGERVQYYQHIHGKHLINGSMARLPSSIFTFYKGNPALIFLSGEPTPASDEELTSNFADVLTWSNSEYVLLHRSLLEDDLAQGMEQFLDTQPNLHRLREEADLVIYRVVVVDPATVP
jgi:hypothetical protein